MKNVTRLLAVLMAVFMVLSVAACHPKDETALTVDGNKITSALYMYALIEADSEARSKIDTAAAEKNTSSGTSSSTTVTTPDYYAEKVDGKGFTEWVKARAIEICQDIALYENLCEENKLELSEEDEANVKNMVDYYWSYYGYSALYEPNGIGKATFTRAMRSDYLKNAYFESIYGEKGTEPVSKEDKEKKVAETFVLAEVLTQSTSEMKDDEKAKVLDTFNAYKARIEKGEKFETIYNEHNKTEQTATSSTPSVSSTVSSSETASTDATSSSTTSSEAEKEPDYKFPYATVMSAADSELNYANESYTAVSVLKMDEVLVEKGDSDVTLFVRRDLMSDERLVKELSETALWVMKEEEFEGKMDDLVKKQSVEKNNYAIDRFKVKKIVYPSYQ